MLILKRMADVYPKAGWPRTDTEWCVLRDGVTVGVIRQIGGGPQAGRWRWGLTVLEPARDWWTGVADSREVAMAAFKAAWERRDAERSKMGNS